MNKQHQYQEILFSTCSLFFVVVGCVYFEWIYFFYIEKNEIFQTSQQQTNKQYYYWPKDLALLAYWTNLQPEKNQQSFDQKNFLFFAHFFRINFVQCPNDTLINNLISLWMSVWTHKHSYTINRIITLYSSIHNLYIHECQK